MQRSFANLNLDTSTFLPLLDNKCYEILQVSCLWLLNVEGRGWLAVADPDTLAARPRTCSRSSRRRGNLTNERES